MKYCDIISRLHAGRYFDHIILKIFLYMDVSSLENVEQVCMTWKQCVKETNMWEEMFTQKVALLSSWRSIVKYLGNFDDSSITHRSNFRNKCIETYQLLQQLDANWRKCSFSIELLLEQEKTSKFFINKTHIVTCPIHGFGPIVVYKRGETLEHVKGFRALAENSILDIDFDDKLMITASLVIDRNSKFSGVITLRDMETGQTLQSIADNTFRFLKIRFGHGLLVLHKCGLIHDGFPGGREPKIPIRSVVVMKMDKSMRVHHETPLVISQAPFSFKGSGFQYDANYVVSYPGVLMEEPRFEIRSTSSLEVVRYICLGFDVFYFEYQNGLLLTSSKGGSNTTLIRLWDVASGECKRLILEESACLVEARMNSKYLLIQSKTYNGSKIKLTVRDLLAALDISTPTKELELSFYEMEAVLGQRRFYLDDYEILAPVHQDGETAKLWSCNFLRHSS